LDSIENFKKERKQTLDLLSKNIISAQKQIDTLNASYKEYSSM
jgi:hypothetical protein